VGAVCWLKSRASQQVERMVASLRDGRKMIRITHSFAQGKRGSSSPVTARFRPFSWPIPPLWASVLVMMELVKSASAESCSGTLPRFSFALLLLLPETLPSCVAVMVKEEEEEDGSVMLPRSFCPPVYPGLDDMIALPCDECTYARADRPLKKKKDEMLLTQAHASTNLDCSCVSPVSEVEKKRSRS
jgi:hypothetical protein